MTIEPVDPPRLEDGDDVALRELMLRRRRGPSATSVEKISQRLAAAGIMHTASGGARRLGSLRAASYKIGGITMLLAGGFLVAWQSFHVSRSAPDANASTSAQGPSTKAPEIAAAAPVAQIDAPLPLATPTPAPLTNESAARTSVSVDNLPSAVAPTVPTAKRSPAIGSAPETTTERGRGAGPAVSELELVQRAEAALASDPQRALAIASEHAHAFPSGEFLQEREVITIDALARLGRKDESLRRAHALLQRFPQTPYAARIKLAVGEALTP